MNFEPRVRPSRRSIGALAVLLAAAIALALFAWQPGETAGTAPNEKDEMMTTNENTDFETKEAIFAGGCFWCIESAFELMPGVVEAISGYTGGTIANPTYEQVSTGTTGHYEAVLVRYNPEEISYEELLAQFWRSINPTDGGGQFFDRGSQYYTAIFTMDEQQQAQAEASKHALDESGKFADPVVTPIFPAQPFYVAENYHQDYFQKYLTQYKAYSAASGRDAYLEETWENDDASSQAPTIDEP